MNRFVVNGGGVWEAHGKRERKQKQKQNKWTRQRMT